MPRKLLQAISCSLVFATNFLYAQAPADPANQRRQLELRRQMELQGKAAAEATAPSDADQAALWVMKLDHPDEKVRSDAVSHLRLLARRVDRSGGQRVQRGEAFEPKVAGLVPILVKAADDKDQWVRYAAVFALADTLDPEAVAVLRKKLEDPSDRVRIVAACLLTEFHDASGIDELKKAVKRFQGETKEVERYMDGEKVLASLEHITGKSFGAIPMNPMLHSDSRRGKEAEQRYQELFDAWTDWWEWTPLLK